MPLFVLEGNSIAGGLAHPVAGVRGQNVKSMRVHAHSTSQTSREVTVCSDWLFGVDGSFVLPKTPVDTLLINPMTLRNPVYGDRETCHISTGESNGPDTWGLTLTNAVLPAIPEVPLPLNAIWSTDLAGAAAPPDIERAVLNGSGTTVTVTTLEDHELIVGEVIDIATIDYTGGAVVVVTIPTSTTFTYTAPGTEEYGDVGESTIFRWSMYVTGDGDEIATVTTQEPHGLVEFQSVFIAGATAYVGTQVVTGVPSSTTFTFTHGSDEVIGGTYTVPAATVYGKGAVGHVYTAYPHGVLVDDVVDIEEVIANYGGAFAVTSIISTNEFTFTTALTPGSVVADYRLLPMSVESVADVTTVSTNSPHGLTTNQVVSMTGSVEMNGVGVGDTFYDGKYGVTVIGEYAFTIPLAGTHAVVGGNFALQSAALVRSGGTVTVTTTTDHNLLVGMRVTFAGVTNFNSTYPVASIDPSGRVFTFASGAGTEGTYEGGTFRRAGTIATYDRATFLLPGHVYTIAGTSNYDGAITVMYGTPQWSYHAVDWRGGADVSGTSGWEDRPGPVYLWVEYEYANKEEVEFANEATMTRIPYEPISLPLGY